MPARFAGDEKGPGLGIHGVQSRLGRNGAAFARPSKAPAMVRHVAEGFARIAARHGQRSGHRHATFTARSAQPPPSCSSRRWSRISQCSSKSRASAKYDVMAEIARGTIFPSPTGERVFTKWGFREVLEKRAAAILQPDLCHAGGITEVRLIAGMAEAYYASDRASQPTGADLAGCRRADRRLDPEFPLPGAGLAR